jgi:hypothetical protein
MGNLLRDRCILVRPIYCKGTSDGVEDPIKGVNLEFLMQPAGFYGKENQGLHYPS